MKAMKTTQFPRDGRSSGWYNVVADVSQGQVLQNDIRADWTVIGAGFTGLACARRLAELHPDDHIVVLDAQGVGQGNSGRNSGWLLNFNSITGSDSATTRLYSRLQQAGLDHLTEVVAKHEIQCDWLPWGTLCFSLNGNARAYIEQLKANCRAAQQPFEEWPAEQVRERIGVKRASEAFFQPGTVLVNPAALAIGLAKSLPPNVTLYEHSPVTGIGKSNDYVVVTESGSITTPKVMVCANGFSPAILNQPSRAVPIAAFSFLSRKLTEAELAILGTDKGHAFISPIRGDSLFRKTLDGRLMCRQNMVRYRPERRFYPEDFVEARKHAQEAISLRWPELGSVDLEHEWGGVVNMTRNNGFLFGQCDNGLYMTAFCNGAHNTRGTISGRLLAELASGVDSSLLQDQLKVPRPTFLPPPPFVRLGAMYEISKNRRAQSRAYAKLS